MTNEKIQELINLGFDEVWLKDIKENFKPKTEGKYKIRIFDCEELDQEPETGIFISAYFFDDERDLSIIHHFFEGLFYIMEDAKAKKELGRGIVDGAPFEEMEEYEGKPWHWLIGEKLGSDFSEREKKRKEEIEKFNSSIKERENFLKNLIEEKTDEIFLCYQEKKGIESGDISPEDAIALDALKEQLMRLIFRVCG